MPTVTLSKKRVEQLMGKRLPIDELKDRISMIGTDLERIDGDEIVVEVFPNRPDMLSEAGFARALSAFIGVKPGLREYKVIPARQEYKVSIDRSVKDVRPYTACAIVKNLKFDDERIRELIQLQEKLHVTFGRNRKKLAIGIYPLDKITLPITFCAKEPSQIMFRPLESETEMTGEEILREHPTGKEFAHLLSEAPRYPLFIDATGEVLSMPPIINSHMTGRVTEDTHEVFIECSGHDMRVLKQCLNIIVTSMADSGAEVYEMSVEDGKSREKTPDLRPLEWDLDSQYISQMTGIQFKETELKKLLEKMGFTTKGKKLLVPPYRTDILHQIDIAEDVAIAYGYENIEPELPNVSTVGNEDDLELFKGRIASILVGIGLVETNSYHITNKETNNARMLMPEEKLVELANSLNQDRSILRSWMLPSLMQIYSENTSREYPQDLFEMGNTFRINPDTETGVEERYMLALAYCEASADLTKAKQALELLMSALDKQHALEQAKHPSFIEGRVASVKVEGRPVGIIGELHPRVLANFGIPMPVAALEIDINILFNIIYGGR